jgi:hypothetical protein
MQGGLLASFDWRATCVEKLGDGSEKLGRCKRLSEKNAVRDTMRGPLVGSGPGHVDDGEFWVDLACRLSDLPAVELALQR